MVTWGNLKSNLSVNHTDADIWSAFIISSYIFYIRVCYYEARNQPNGSGDSKAQPQS